MKNKHEHTKSKFIKISNIISKLLNEYYYNADYRVDIGAKSYGNISFIESESLSEIYNSCIFWMHKLEKDDFKTFTRDMVYLWNKIYRALIKEYNKAKHLNNETINQK